MHRAKIKYMGSKRAMLNNGLGELLNQEMNSASRFVDLFAGSGAVAIYVAQQFPVPIVAIDLQQYSVVVTSAVIGRQRRLGWQRIWEAWEARAARTYKSSVAPDSSDHPVPKGRLCARH